MKVPMDMAGMKFGKWMVEHKISNFNTHCHESKWNCICECGKEKQIYRSSLIGGDSKSCGCSTYFRGNKNPLWGGYGEISLRTFNLIRRSARKREIPFDLDIKSVWELFITQDRKCALSGLDLKFESLGNSYDGTASLDRIDSSIGYIPTNVHWVHKEINIMKSIYTSERFIELCRTITYHNNRTSCIVINKGKYKTPKKEIQPTTFIDMGASTSLIGMKFGKMTVESKNSNFNNHRHESRWNCICECGKKIQIYESLLMSDVTKHCNCSPRLIGNKNPRWEGYGEISPTHFSTIKKSARDRGIEFDIDIKYIWKLFLKQSGKCSLSGRNLKFETHSRSYDGSASLDRIDSSKGYVKGNLQWLHKEINIMKRHHSDKHFIEMCDTITQYNRNKNNI